METMTKAWRLCQRHGDCAKGMETMAKVWRLCQRYRVHANGGDRVEGMVMSLRPGGTEALPKASLLSLGYEREEGKEREGERERRGKREGEREGKKRVRRG